MTEPERPVLLWVRSTPHSTVHLSEGIRLAAMSTALDLPVRWLFIADGVRALVGGQEAYRYAPPLSKTLAGIVANDRPALVHLPSLARRSIPWEALLEGLPLQPVGDEEAAEWVLRASRVVPL